MPWEGPHPLAFFLLVAMNDRTKEIAKNHENAHHASVFVNSESRDAART
jgi:hypothetical protein